MIEILGSFAIAIGTLLLGFATGAIVTLRLERRLERGRRIWLAWKIGE